MAAGNVIIAPMNSQRASDIAGAWMTALWTWLWTAGATTSYRTRCTLASRWWEPAWGWLLSVTYHAWMSVAEVTCHSRMQGSNDRCTSVNGHPSVTRSRGCH